MQEWQFLYKTTPGSHARRGTLWAIKAISHVLPVSVHMGRYYSASLKTIIPGEVEQNSSALGVRYP